MNEKRLEILLLSKNENESVVFEEASEIINAVFEVKDEGINNFKQTDYFFICEENGNNFLVNINKSTYKDKIILFVSLYTEHQMEATPFYDLKILLKDSLRSLADKIYWIYDEQNEKQSQELYQIINKAENSFRVLIINYMTSKYGLDWWDQIPKQVRKEDRQAGYLSSLTDFKDINLDMYFLDITDLTRLLESEYKFDVNFTVDFKTRHEFPTDKEIVRKSLRKELKQLIEDQFDYVLKDEKGFWKHELAVFFNNAQEFKEKWDRLSNDRNHIAHNKIIDMNMYEIMKRNGLYVIEELQKAISKVNQSEVSQEEINFLNFVTEETKRNDIEGQGVGILANSQIEQIFSEFIVDSILSPADDMIYFCEALKSSYTAQDIDLVAEERLIEITGFNDEAFIVSINEFIPDDDEGAESRLTLTMKNDSDSKKFVITYRNSTVELNEDGMYRLETEGELDTYDLEKDVDSEQGVDNEILFQLQQFINEQPSNRALEKLEED
ncbi:hypothetical protein [Virgibacillus halodenitrificans]|uniref:Apea-like HEPN domain-containing protein n=1 Tax=Virgibacillus halodenitrificans TaxID=1482 RepID=A0ABR7VTQ3_VIRHA|nr:hypothetical protein [Virgibacillus halodenitrificans]MBD1224660.1 hypothetical protein [Virgibacillus halodenitrificans]